MFFQFFLLRHRSHNTLQNENDWDSDKARQASGEHRRPRSGLSPTLDIDGPEYGPGAIFGPSGVYTPGVSASSGVHAGVIVAIPIAIAVVAVLYLQLCKPQTSAGDDHLTIEPMLPEQTAPPSSEPSQTMGSYIRCYLSGMYNRLSSFS